MTAITRFAPSPTGYLHVGGARTALFSWLYARKQKGKFILRIEDTDLQRSTQEYVSAIFAGMEWLGLDCDVGPVYQTQRMSRYQEVIQQLLDQGNAYYCTCSSAELFELREKQRANQEKPRYNEKCRLANHPFVAGKTTIRFKNPDNGSVIINDLIKGKLTIANKELDDLIISRSDGSPTYNLAVVVDDMDMDVTHILRGDDHINNTPRQLNILTALGSKHPQYAHVPMILGPDGSRLSKRHGAVSVLQYRDEGYLPNALLNYLVRLGWSCGDQEIFSVDEMIAKFELTNINVSAAIFNPEKLLWLNKHYIMHSDPKYVAKHLKWHMQALAIDLNNGPDLIKIVQAQKERCKTLLDMANASVYFYQEFTSYDAKSVKKYFDSGTVAILEHLISKFNQLSNWENKKLQQIVLDTTETMQLNLGKIAQPLRIAISGASSSPPIDITLALLGKNKTLLRLHRAIEFIHQNKL